MTLLEGRTLFRVHLKHLYDQNEIDFYFKILLSHFFHLDATQLALTPSQELDVDHIEDLKRALYDLSEEKPIQYITGLAYFRSLELEVTPDVLIPRPETEELVEWVVETYSGKQIPKTILDIGTGSGCIALSLAQELPHCKVIGIDVRSEVLKIAKKNGERNKVAVEWSQQNILEWKNGSIPADVIVSNPPYIMPKEKNAMKKNVLNYEPHLALFVEGEDPLLFYNKIIAFANQHLTPYGRLFFEVNPVYIDALKQGIDNIKTYTYSERLDIFGKRRMVCLQKG
ncbi:MAG: peptide chain release factor N(5)-glutamine methyltransferase [Flavobacteriaceae bacterium]